MEQGNSVSSSEPLAVLSKSVFDIVLQEALAALVLDKDSDSSDNSDSNNGREGKKITLAANSAVHDLQSKQIDQFTPTVNDLQTYANAILRCLASNPQYNELMVCNLSRSYTHP